MGAPQPFYPAFGGRALRTARRSFFGSVGPRTEGALAGYPPGRRRLSFPVVHAHSHQLRRPVPCRPARLAPGPRDLRPRAAYPPAAAYLPPPGRDIRGGRRQALQESDTTAEAWNGPAFAGRRGKYIFLRLAALRPGRSHRPLRDRAALPSAGEVHLPAGLPAPGGQRGGPARGAVRPAGPGGRLYPANTETDEGRPAPPASLPAGGLFPYLLQPRHERGTRGRHGPVLRGLNFPFHEGGRYRREGRVPQMRLLDGGRLLLQTAAPRPGALFHPGAGGLMVRLPAAARSLGLRPEDPGHTAPVRAAFHPAERRLRHTEHGPGLRVYPGPGDKIGR